MSIFPTLRSLVGRRLFISKYGNLVASPYGTDFNVSQPCVNATIAIGAENTNVRTITVQLLDANGEDINYVETFELIVFSDTTRTAFATGGSTGVAIGTDGAAVAIVAKKHFLCTSEADGDWDGTWTDTGTESVAIGIRLPNGRIVMSDAFANT